MLQLANGGRVARLRRARRPSRLPRGAAAPWTPRSFWGPFIFLYIGFDFVWFGIQYHLMLSIFTLRVIYYLTIITSGNCSSALFTSTSPTITFGRICGLHLSVDFRFSTIFGQKCEGFSDSVRSVNDSRLLSICREMWRIHGNVEHNCYFVFFNYCAVTIL